MYRYETLPLKEPEVTPLKLGGAFFFFASRIA
jgi:hypothetical protein